MTGRTEEVKSLLEKLTVPIYLAIVTSLGFFSILGLLFFVVIPSGNKEILVAMIGVAGNLIGTIIGYHFGSSSGSAAKTDALLKKEEPKG